MDAVLEFIWSIGKLAIALVAAAFCLFIVVICGMALWHIIF